MTTRNASPPAVTPNPCRRIHRSIAAAFGDTGGYGIAVPTRFDSFNLLVLWNGFHGLPRIGAAGTTRFEVFYERWNHVTPDRGVEPTAEFQIPWDVRDRIWRVLLLSEREYDIALPFIVELQPFAKRVAKLRAGSTPHCTTYDARIGHEVVLFDASRRFQPVRRSR